MRSFLGFPAYYNGNYQKVNLLMREYAKNFVYINRVSNFHSWKTQVCEVREIEKSEVYLKLSTSGWEASVKVYEGH